MTIRTECIEWAEESFEECAEWEDQGERACDDWDDRCCDWWPCSWACEVITWVCVAWVWVSNIVCVAWTVVTTVTCVAWEIVTVLVTPIAWILKQLESIPIIGRLINEIRNIINSIIWRVVGVIDLIASAIGIRPLKKLRLCIIILRDENGNPVTTEAGLATDIAAAQTIFRNAANIEVIVEGIHTVDRNAPTYALDVNCDAAAWGEDLWLTGSYFNWVSTNNCPTSAASQLSGYANTITVMCVRNIPGNTAGCALGPTTDYLTIEGGNPVCLAHEIGHKVGLWHCCAATNLANGICGGTDLDWWQIAIARNSKYVTYV